MARLAACGLLVVVAALFPGSLGAIPAACSGDGSPELARRTGCVSADELAARFGLKLTWLEQGAGLGETDHGVKRARFVVLRDARCPAVLVEGGVLSNPTEAQKMASPAYREKLAHFPARGMQDYVALPESSRPRATE